MIKFLIKLQLYFSAKVDVEKPEFESESFRVLIFRKLRIQVEHFNQAGDFVKQCDILQYLLAIYSIIPFLMFFFEIFENLT
jgi:hypothetical protein